MHKWVYDKTECLKNELENIGMDNLSKEQLEEAYYFSKILKNMVEVDQMYHIVDAMENAETEDVIDKIGKYRGYSEKYMPNIYKEWSDTSESERLRDLDRMSKGRMYYTDRRRMYMETKNSADKNVKMQKLDEYLNELKEDMKELVADMTPEEKSMWKTRLTNMASTM